MHLAGCVRGLWHVMSGEGLSKGGTVLVEESAVVLVGGLQLAVFLRGRSRAGLVQHLHQQPG